VGVSRVAFVFSVGRARRVERDGGVARATTSAPEFTPKKGKRNEGNAVESERGDDGTEEI